MSITITIDATLGATGLTGAAGFVVYNPDWTVFQTRSASVSTIAQIGSSTTYSGSFTGTAGATYYYIWDDGAGNYSTPGVVNPPVDVAAVAGSVAQVGDGTASAVSSNTITIPSVANLAGWSIRILSATTGQDQLAVIASSGTPSGGSAVQTLAANWSTTPTGTIVYQLIPPSAASGDTSGTTTLLSRLTSTRAGYLDNLSAGAVALASQIPSHFTNAAFVSDGVFATAALANAPTGGGGSDTPGTTTLLGRLTSTRSGYLDNLSGGAVALASQFPSHFTNGTFSADGVFAAGAFNNMPGSLTAGAVAAGSTTSAVIVSGLPSGKNYTGQHLYHGPSGEARVIASQTTGGGNYTFAFTGTAGTTAGPFSAVSTADVVIPSP